MCHFCIINKYYFSLLSVFIADFIHFLWFLTVTLFSSEKPGAADSRVPGSHTCTHALTHTHTHPTAHSRMCYHCDVPGTKWILSKCHAGVIPYHMPFTLNISFKVQLTLEHMGISGTHPYAVKTPCITFNSQKS